MDSWRSNHTGCDHGLYTLDIVGAALGRPTICYRGVCHLSMAIQQQTVCINGWGNLMLIFIIVVLLLVFGVNSSRRVGRLIGEQNQWAEAQLAVTAPQVYLARKARMRRRRRWRIAFWLTAAIIVAMIII